MKKKIKPRAFENLFGYAAGVGKTYTMLKAAHIAKNQGVDVVAGYIEPHARPKTVALLNGLELLPTKEVEYNGITLHEFDIDAALKRSHSLYLWTSLPIQMHKVPPHKALSGYKGAFECGNRCLYNC